MTDKGRDGERDRLIGEAARDIRDATLRTGGFCTDITALVEAGWRPPPTGDVIEQAARVMGEHYLDTSKLDADRNSPCVCGRWTEGPMEPGWDDHLADVLADAGLLRAPALGQLEAKLEGCVSIPVPPPWDLVERMAKAAYEEKPGNDWDKFPRDQQERALDQIRAALRALGEATP